MRANDRAKISTRLKSAIDLKLLCALCKLGKPLLGLADHHQCTQSHTSLTSGSKSGAGNGVQGMVLVAVGENGGVVLGSQVGLYTLTVGAAAGVDVFAGFVATDERDGLDSGLVKDEVHGLVGAVNDVDHTGWETGFTGKLGQDHSGTGVAFRGFDDNGVSGDGGNGDTPEGDHSWEVYTYISLMDYDNLLAGTH